MKFYSGNNALRYVVFNRNQIEIEVTALWRNFGVEAVKVEGLSRQKCHRNTYLSESDDHRHCILGL